MGSGVDRSRHAERGPPEHVPVERDLESLALVARRKLDLEPRQVGLDRGDVLVGERHAILATVALREGFGVVELGPRAGEPSLLLATDAEIQESARGWIEALA